MVTPLISQADLVEYTEASVQIDWRKLIPSIRYVQDQRLRPLIGEPLYEDIVAADPPDAQQQALIDVCKPMLCFWTLYEAIPFIHFEIRNKGLMKPIDNTAEGVTGGEMAVIRDACKNRAEVMEKDIIRYLRANQGQYPLWGGDCQTRPSGSLTGRLIGRPPARTTSISDLATPKRPSKR